MLLGAVTQALMHWPQPVQASPITGWPSASMRNASSPTGQTRAQTPHSTPRYVMHRVESTATSAMWTSRQPQAGKSNAGVGQAAAQAIDSHMTQAWLATSSTGVPPARPCDAGSRVMAWTGQAVTQSPQRVQAPTNAGSGNAPGGRT